MCCHVIVKTSQRTTRDIYNLLSQVFAYYIKQPQHEGKKSLI